jgi:glutathione reductase (NADPH)
VAAFELDLLVIGAGSAGVRAARVAAELGARVAVVEADKVGGTCVNAGCIPKKLLVYAAEYGRAFDDARGYGWSPGARSFDWSSLIEHKNSEIERLNAVYRRSLETAGATLIAGRAKLIDAHSAQVGGRVLRSRYTLVATGGHPRAGQFEGCEHAITSDDAFHLERLPERITIVGGGYIALEFAGIFHNLGARVRLVHRGARILGGFDSDLRDHLTRELRRQGVDLRCGVTVRALRLREGELCAELSDGASDACGHLMLAIGRDPRTHGLGLEQVGVRLDAGGGVIVDDLGRSTVENIFAAGDCTGRLALTPVAIAEGEAIARALFGTAKAGLERERIPTAVFSQPPLAKVGLAEHEARERGIEIEVYRSQFTPLRHRLSGRDEQSLIKVIVDKQSQRLLGCHMVGADAPEIIQGLAVAMNCGATKDQLDSTIGIHPTAAEEFVTLRTKIA